MADKHFATCENKQKHFEALKTIFQDSLEQPVEAPVLPDNSALVKQLQEQIKKLKRELEYKEAEVADCQQKVDAFDGLIECIFDKVNEEEREEWRDWLKSNKEGIEWEDYL